jgi:hypothetical protein
VVAGYPPEVPRWLRIRNFSHALRASVLPHVQAGDFKATLAVGTNRRFKSAMSAVIADGAALGRKRQTGMDASPSAVEFGVPGWRSPTDSTSAQDHQTNA